MSEITKEKIDELADFVHEHHFCCQDPKTGKGRDCLSCVSLAHTILEWQATGVYVRHEMSDAEWDAAFWGKREAIR